MSKIRYKPLGETFVEKAGPFDIRYREIESWEFRRLKRLGNKEVDHMMREEVSTTVLMFGYYGISYKVKGNKFFVGMKVGRK